MPHVVTEPCYQCKHTDCVVVCPAECFHEGETMVFIDPDTCIDCFACESECPTNAIFIDSEVPKQWKEYIALNSEMAERTPVLTEKRVPLTES